MTSEAQLPTSDEMTERLSDWVERFRVAGATVAWMKGDEIQAAAAGVVNRRTGVETTADSVFQIGSITKVYTTTLIMQLVDEGRIDLDAPAVKYLPDLRFADTAETAKVVLTVEGCATAGTESATDVAAGKQEVELNLPAGCGTGTKTLRATLEAGDGSGPISPPFSNTFSGVTVQ